MNIWAVIRSKALNLRFPAFVVDLKVVLGHNMKPDTERDQVNISGRGASAMWFSCETQDAIAKAGGWSQQKVAERL